MRKLLFIILFFSVSVCFAEEIDVFKLAENGTPEQLKDAVTKGADFNVERYGISAEKLGISTDDWLFYNGETPLFRAAYYNHNPKSIRFLISLGLNVNTYADHGGSGEFGGTPLSCAIKAGNIGAVQELLKAGADPNAFCKDENEEIRVFQVIACIADSNKKLAKDIIRMLVQAGLKINDHSEYKTAEKASEEEVLIRYRGYDILYSSRTNLIFAVIHDNPNLVDILLDFKANPDIRDITNKIALDYAMELPINSKIRRSSAFRRLRRVTKANVGQGIKSGPSSETD